MSFGGTADHNTIACALSWIGQAVTYNRETSPPGRKGTHSSPAALTLQSHGSQAKTGGANDDDDDGRGEVE